MQDQTSNNNDGTINGASWSTDTPDATLPTVTNVTSTTSDGTLKVGDVVAITVTFSEAVTVSGTSPDFETDLQMRS